MLVLSNLLLMGYSVAYMLGTRSALHPGGFPALLCVLLLATGSLLAALSYAAVSLTRSRRWKIALAPKNKLPILLGLGAGFCHYGGTILQIYSLPLLSAPVSALLTKTSSLWTYMWGIVYGEYKGTSARVKKILAVGILVFVIGIVMLTFALYK